MAILFLNESVASAEDLGRHAPHAEPSAATAARPQSIAPPSLGEKVVFIGNGLAERDIYYSHLETELYLRFPDKNLIIRNMGRPGDTPGFRPHPSRISQWAFPGADRFHPDKTKHSGQGFFPTPDQWLTHLKADTIVAFFGYNESFDGPDRVANFESELDAFTVHTLSKAYNGSAAPRLILVSPIAFENQSSLRDLPNGKRENENLTLYVAAVKRVATKHSLTFKDLFKPSLDHYAKAKEPFTTHGFIPTQTGYRILGEWLASGIYGPSPKVSKADPANLLAAVQQKNGSGITTTTF